jgi:hypothetical protein
MQPKGFDTLDGPTPVPTRIVRCLTALAHFAHCKPHKIVNGVGEMCDHLGGRIEDVVFVAGYHGDDSQEKSRGFVSPLGSRARQTSMSGSLGTLALYATPPIRSIRQSRASSGKASMA